MNSYTRLELLNQCEEKGFTGYKSKNKAELVSMLSLPSAVITPEQKVQRLNYIGSKYQLLDWITTNIIEKTGYSSLNGIRIADLFAGTGIISHHLRKLGATIISNDAELFSSIITHAMTKSGYTEQCKLYIEQFEGESNTSGEIGYITKNYSPYNGNERMFFTVENARLIDFYRKRIEEVRQTITDDEYNFLLGTLLVRADAVSNVPAVYGCYLKNFKDKATKKLRLIPVHMETGIANDSRVYNLDVLDDELIHNINVDITYLDPPYNERQYSKNYFPLNMIAKSLEDNPELKGKTGIPSNCFLSPFCRKGKAVEEAFEKLFRDLKSKWIVLSYNSESIVSKEKMIELMSRYGSVSVIEREYKRFKSFEYNKNVPVLEYLFFLKKL